MIRFGVVFMVRLLKTGSIYTLHTADRPVRVQGGKPQAAKVNGNGLLWWPVRQRGDGHSRSTAFRVGARNPGIHRHESIPGSHSRSSKPDLPWSRIDNHVVRS